MAEEKAEKESTGTEAGDAAPAKPKSNLMLIIIIGVAITVITPVATFFVVKATVPAPVVVEKKSESTSLDTYDLGENYINIAETKGTRILKLQPVLVISDAKMVDGLKAIDPLLKDRIITAASTKTIDELEGQNGKETLKREIISLVNAAIKDKMDGAVLDVLYSQFLIQ